MRNLTTPAAVPIAVLLLTILFFSAGAADDADPPTSACPTAGGESAL
jgi:hypothetical protein